MKKLFLILLPLSFIFFSCGGRSPFESGDQSKLILISPANEAKDVATTVPVSWSYNAQEGTQVIYNVYADISPKTQPTNLELSTTDTSGTIGALPATEYVWKVAAIVTYNNGIDTIYSEVSSFTTTTGACKPMLISPYNGKTDVNTDAPVLWTYNVPEGFQATYIVYADVSTEILPTTVRITTPDTSAIVYGLQPGTEYVWRVAATDNIETIYSAISTFTTTYSGLHKLVGTWEFTLLTQITNNDTLTSTPEELDLKVTAIFRSDSTFTMIRADEGEVDTTNGEWYTSGTTLTMEDTEGEVEEAEYIVSGNKTTITYYDDALIMIFEFTKQSQ